MLDALELGSEFTWDLAHKDLLGTQPFYGKDGNTPYVFIFCGDTDYEGVREFVNTPGTDGTVRWAGCVLNTRKISVDLTVGPAVKDEEPQQAARWSNYDIPVHIVPGLDHGTIHTAPPDERGDGITDYHLQIYRREDGGASAASARR